MKLPKQSRLLSFIGWMTCAFLALLLAACRPVDVSINLPPAQATATQTPAQDTQPSVEPSGDITLDLSGVAQAYTVEMIPAVPPSAGAPYWEAAPQHRRITLEGYPVPYHSLKPQIYIYPVADWIGINEPAAGMITGLQTLLQAPQPVEHMPFLPLFNLAQAMHAQVKTLDLKDGTGVRFLTQFNQGPLPVNNYGLIYTLQGLTSDGQYYIAAILPVTHPDLPVTQAVSTQQSDELSDFPAYLAETTAWLEQQPGSSFTPDLGMLDTLIQSLGVR